MSQSSQHDPEDFGAPDPYPEGRLSRVPGSGRRGPEESRGDVIGLRVPPQSVEAEQSVLGGLLLDNTAFDKIADVVVAADFYRHEHQEIFSVMVRMIAEGKPADVITVFDALVVLGKDEDTGGLKYLNSLANSVPGAANIVRYAEIVKERSTLRNLASAGDEIAENARATKGRSVDEIVNEAEAKIFRIGESGARQKTGFVGIDALMVNLIDEIQARADSKEDLVGTSTGFIDLDRLTSGMQSGDLIVLAARPSMGKTSLAINIGEHVAIKAPESKRKPVMVFSMEMGASQLSLRIVGSVGRIDQQRLRSGKISDDEWGRLAEALDTVRGAQLFIDDTAGLNPAEMRARARRLARQMKTKPGLIIVDYLQLMTGSSTSANENRATEVGEISRSLKALAKEMDCPVIALSQLNRSVEQRGDKRPMMSDLRESGSIEQDADVIMFIYRDDYYNKDTKEPGVAEIIIGKQRNGPTGTVKLAWNGGLTQFSNLAPSYEY